MFKHRLENYSYLKDQQAIKGRAKIEKARQEQLAQIETRRQAALLALNIKYANADKVKTSFGYIGIVSLSIMYGAFILNDLMKLLLACYREMRSSINDQEENQTNDSKKIEEREDKDKNDECKYEEELEEKLENFHFHLIKAVAKNRRLKQTMEYDA